jgi:hypothetical protein
MTREDRYPAWLMNDRTPEGRHWRELEDAFADTFPTEFDKRWAAELRAEGWSLDQVAWLFRLLGAQCTRGTIVAWELGWEVE